MAPACSASVTAAWCRSPPASSWPISPSAAVTRSEEHTSELQSRVDLVCRLLLEKKKNKKFQHNQRRQSEESGERADLPPIAHAHRGRRAPGQEQRQRLHLRQDAHASILRATQVQ